MPAYTKHTHKTIKPSIIKPSIIKLFNNMY